MDQLLNREFHKHIKNVSSPRRGEKLSKKASKVHRSSPRMGAMRGVLSREQRIPVLKSSGKQRER
jgi:hypothetical protein